MTLEHPDLGKHSVHTSSFRLSGISSIPARPAPRLGEHTAAICTELLQVPEEEFARLLVEGVLE